MQGAYNASAGSAVLRAEGETVVQVSEEFTDLTGFSESEASGRSLGEVTRMLKADSQIELADIDGGADCYIFTKVLEPLNVNIRCENVDDNHRAYRFVRNSDMTLRDRLPYAESLLAENRSAMAVISYPGLILLRANQSLLQLLDSPFNVAENSIGRNFIRILPAGLSGGAEKTIGEAARTGSASYPNPAGIRRGAEDAVCGVSVVPVRISGAVKYMVYNCVQTRAQSDAAKPIKTSRGRLGDRESLMLKAQYDLIRGLVENFDLGCTRITYPDFNVCYLNSKACEELKIINPDVGSKADVIGKCIFDTFKYDEREIALVTEDIKRVIGSGGGHYSVDRRFIGVGEEKYFKVLFQPIINIGGHADEMAVFTVDITEEIMDKKRMESALKAQDEILANVSHELKTPLNVIFTAVQLIEFYMRSGSLEENRRNILKGIDSIKQNCYRFTKLINNIVDISKMDSGALKLNLSNHDIVEVIGDIVKSVACYANQKGLEITFDTDTEKRIISCDRDKIERVVLNLISNSIKFTNPGGRIFVSVKDTGAGVEISVRDTGIGIDKKDLGSIFDRYYQVDKSLSRNAEGSGIGLALVKSLVELHGGSVDVKSRANSGSTFTITLPSNTEGGDEISADSMDSDSKEAELVKVELSDIYTL